mgnify:CR=1 FL=1|jgi:hypothetical protein
MLQKFEKIGSRDITGSGHIQVRHDTEIWDGSELISTTYRREVIVPGQDVSAKAVEIQRIAAIEHTPEVIKAYLEHIRMMDFDNT